MQRLTLPRLLALVVALCGVLLHVYQLQLVAVFPLPKPFTAPPLLWSCATYACAVALSVTRHQWPAVAFAVAALVLDGAAHYLAFMRPLDRSRFAAPGLPLYLFPVYALAIVGPAGALLVALVQRHVTRRRSAA